jgi:hypothetical protein
MLRFYPRKGFEGPVFREWWWDRKKRDAEETEQIIDYENYYWGLGTTSGSQNLALTVNRLPKNNLNRDAFLCKYEEVDYIFHLYSGGTLAATWKIYATHGINLEDGEDHTFVLVAPYVSPVSPFVLTSYSVAADNGISTPKRLGLCCTSMAVLSVLAPMVATLGILS